MDRFETIMALGILANLTVINKAIGTKISLDKAFDLASDLMPASLAIGSNPITTQEQKEHKLIEAAEELYKAKYMN